MAFTKKLIKTLFFFWFWKKCPMLISKCIMSLIESAWGFNWKSIMVHLKVNPDAHSIDPLRSFNPATYKSFFKINHETSPKLHGSYYPHRSRDSLSPVCRTFLIGIYWPKEDFYLIKCLHWALLLGLKNYQFFLFVVLIFFFFAKSFDTRYFWKKVIIISKVVSFFCCIFFIFCAYF